MINVLLVLVFTVLSYLPQDQQTNLKQSELYFSHQILNHFDYSNKIRWNQRYYKYDQYFDSQKGSVILYICGEYTCTGISNTRQWPIQIAKQLKASLVLEHRFYGKSIPTNLQTQSLNLLNKEQALSDLAYFITYIKSTNMFNVTNNPWITIGGSYPGALSAWFRQKYPYLTVGAIASSAVVNLIQNFWQFDQQIYLSSSKSGAFCVNSILQVSKHVQSIVLQGGQNLQSLKQSFKASKLKNGQFLFFFSDIIVQSIQYGQRTQLCSNLTGNINNDLKYLQKQAQSIANPSDYGSYYISNVTYATQTTGNARQWTWQTCTQVGFFQTPSNTHPMRSQLLNITFWKQWCNDSFGDIYQPSVQRGNMQLGGINIDIDHLIMINGVQDPWRWASIQRNQGKVEAHIVDCNDCAHCQDLHTPSKTDSKSLKNIRTIEMNRVKKWVKKHWISNNQYWAQHAEWLIEEQLIQDN